MPESQAVLRRMCFSPRSASQILDCSKLSLMEGKRSVAQISPSASTTPAPTHPCWCSCSYLPLSHPLSFIIELGHSASVCHSKALPVMRPENTPGANGRDARHRFMRAGVWANGKWRWALVAGNGEKKKTKQEEEVSGGHVQDLLQNLQDGQRLRGQARDSKVTKSHLLFPFAT